MWVFGYGSLMWDGWEKPFSGDRLPGALLRGFRRAFNKASSKNWGTSEKRGPTLGLEPDQDAEVVGIAFEFGKDRRQAILATLARREGRSFTLETHEILLPDGRAVQGIVPVNDRQSRTYIGNLAIDQRVQMALAASGASGSCADYVLKVQEELRSLDINDTHVDEFAQILQRKIVVGAPSAKLT